jgi:O-acetyl-ADP-ribose deacetylase (regulator of RNase III)
MVEKVNRVVIECKKGDIAGQNDLEAVVNAANAQLLAGGGVDGAMHRAAGPALASECRKYAPISCSEAVITSAYNLPNRYVIHCLGPVYGEDKPSDKLLADCYKNALNLAEKKGIESIGFPAISTGAFGYPLQEAAHIAIKTVKEKARQLNKVKKIRFILYSDKAYNLHKKILEE